MKKRLSRMTVSGSGSRQRHVHQPGQDVDCLRAVFEDAPEGVCVLDCSLRLVVWNRAATEMTGCPASEVLGQRCSLKDDTLVLDPSGIAVDPAVLKVQKRELSSVSGFQITAKSRGGLPLNIPTAVMPLRHANLSFFVHLFRPIPIPLEVRDRIECPIIRRAPLKSLDLPKRACLPVLTPREHEILRLLAEGQTAKPIAAALSLATPTVRTHIQNILRKLEVRSCLEAVVRFLRMEPEDPFCNSGSGRASAVEFMAGSGKWGHPGSKR